MPLGCTLCLVLLFTWVVSLVCFPESGERSLAPPVMARDRRLRCGCTFCQGLPFPLLVALLLGPSVPAGVCSARHFSRGSCIRYHRYLPITALAWIVAGMPYGVFLLSRPPSFLGWLPVLVSLRPVCACLQHPSCSGFPQPDVITPCSSSACTHGQILHAWSPCGWWCSRASRLGLLQVCAVAAPSV